MLVFKRSAIAFLPKRELGHQLVAACLGDQDGGSSGVLLELLPQPVDVRLERGRPGGFIDDQLIFGGLPDRALGVTMLRLSRPSKAVE